MLIKKYFPAKNANHHMNGQLRQSSYDSNIKDDWSQISLTNVTVMKKVQNIAKILNTGHAQTGREQMLLDVRQWTCLVQGCHKPSA